MNATTVTSRQTIESKLKAQTVSLEGRVILAELSFWSRSLISGYWMISLAHSQLFSKYCILMMKDKFVARVASLYSLAIRSDNKCPAEAAEMLEEFYQTGDKILLRMGMNHLRK